SSWPQRVERFNVGERPARRRDLIRLAVHSVNTAVPQDIMTNAVIIPSWNKNTTMRIVNRFISPSTRTRRTIASRSTGPRSPVELRQYQTSDDAMLWLPHEQ